MKRKILLYQADKNCKCYLFELLKKEFDINIYASEDSFEKALIGSNPDAAIICLESEINPLTNKVHSIEDKIKQLTKFQSSIGFQ